ncbi:MAG: prepilin peptidase [Deltaproteobacteria bacterium]|nr:prepilin peptidase [Deltaproteobacteria bacterium]
MNNSKPIVRFITGGVAVACSMYFAFVVGLSDVTVLLASLFILTICITDTLNAKIPNVANLGLIVAGSGYNLYLSGFSGFITSVAGLVTGLLLLIIPYLMGGMGAGDVKALAALGALLGPANVFQVFLYIALVGGAMAILHYVMADNFIHKCRSFFTTLRTFIYTRNFKLFIPDRQGERLRFPYAAAIAFGFFAFVQWGPLI